MIALLRIDNRLLHAAISFNWAPALEVDCILLACSGLTRDTLRKSAALLSKPPRIHLLIFGVEEAAARLNAGLAREYKILLITENIADAYLLCERCGDLIRNVNLGGTRRSPGGGPPATRAARLTSEEKKNLCDLARMGVKVDLRSMPGDEKFFFRGA